MELNAVKQAATPAPTFTAPKRAEAAREVVQPQAVNAEVDSVVSDQQVKDLSQVEKQRLDTVVKGAQAMKSTIGGATGMTFSIFKDVNGQFITRFTNKTTGAVTYVPEPNVLNFAETSASSSLLAVDA
jgi:hypothetical protein